MKQYILVEVHFDAGNELPSHLAAHQEDVIVLKASGPYPDHWVVTDIPSVLKDPDYFPNVVDEDSPGWPVEHSAKCPAPFGFICVCGGSIPHTDDCLRANNVNPYKQEF